jgi:alanyl-tRNA synthetase
MTSDEIRERYLAFFEERGHRRIPSASLVPSAHDPSALLTVAGMHPLKPYFLAEETPPAPRLTSCQKVFRAVDIDNVGNTARHLTFFEMLGNFSFGDYFKREAIEFAWQLSREVFGFSAKDIWVTVFEGDDALGLGPDEEAIACWLDVGMERERIVECPRSENFWQAGPTGPCGPCSELYIDRGVDRGSAEDLPGGENERFLEYWNLVFMQYEATAVDGAGNGGGGSPPERAAPPQAQAQSTILEPLPANNIDTGLGLNRLAAILQGKRSVFETDQFQPLIELGEELSGRRYGEDLASARALRILADHARAMTFLVADGVVPSNEDRGYVLRRVMRRAIQQGRGLELEPGFLTRYADRVRELMGGAYPELVEQRAAIESWLSAEEEGFGRTLSQGMATLRLFIDQARDAGRSAVPAAEVFRLHDTYGFPYEMTGELLAQEGLSMEGDFEHLMDEQRARSRAGRVSAGAGASAGAAADASEARAAAGSFAGESAFQTRFTGYETERQRTTVGAVTRANGSWLVKLAESPFYAAGGGQVADVGTIECEHGDCRARVQEVFRLGDDQALAVLVEEGALRAGEQVVATVDHAARHATECNHTATHLLQAALRERLGSHVRQAGSYVGPDKLRFDFSHGRGLSDEELKDVEDRVNEWVARNDRVRPITTTLAEAKRLGAMALFGEKYGEVVRMVEVGDGEHSRELCGGTHVRSTAEIGPFLILSETSSAANVRRIEALTGPGAVERLRQRDRELRTIETGTRVPADRVVALVGELRATARSGSTEHINTAVNIDALAQSAVEVGGASVLTEAVDAPDARALLEVVDRLKGKLGEAAIVLGTAVDGRVHLVASVAPSLVERGVNAGAIVKVAAEVVGGGGGGRATMAQAGGRHPERLGEAIATARRTIETALTN